MMPGNCSVSGNSNANQSQSSSNHPEEGPSTQSEAKSVEPAMLRRAADQQLARFPQAAAWIQRTARQLVQNALHPQEFKLGTINPIPVPGTEHLLPRQKKGVAGDGQWRKGLNYSSTVFASESTCAEFNLLPKPDRQSDLYADIFGGLVNSDNRNIKNDFEDGHDKLRAALGNDTARVYLDRRNEHLNDIATKARHIRDKLDQIWSRGQYIKWGVSKGAGGFMLAQNVKAFKLNVGTRPMSAQGEPLQNPHSLPFKTFIFESIPVAVGAAQAAKVFTDKVHDNWWRPEYFTGLKKNRKDIAEMAEDFRERTHKAAEARATDAVVKALNQEYGEDGRKFLECLMNEVDRCAYNYMLALQSRPSKFMQADEHLDQSGVTVASHNLLIARLEEARFLNTFSKDKKPVVRVVEYDDSALSGTVPLIEAKAPSQMDEQASSSARDGNRSPVNFNYMESWDYSRPLPQVLEYLESKAEELSLSRDMPKKEWELIESDLKAAKKGSKDKEGIEAMLRLAKRCEAGTFSVPKGAELNRITKELYTPAAEHGHAEAQYHLGRLYADKSFTPRFGLRDTWAAVKWLTKAAEQGNYQASEALNQIPAAYRSDVGNQH